MTTQATTASVFASKGGRSYSVTATDGQWNRLVSDTGSAQLGFAQTNEIASMIQLTMAAGLGAWRVRNSVSQVTKRVGFAFEVGGSGPAPYSGAIPTFSIAQDDVLEIYTLATP